MVSLSSQREAEIRQSELQAFFLLAVVAAGNMASIVWLYVKPPRVRRQEKEKKKEERDGQMTGIRKCRHKWFEDCEPGVCDKEK
jgi:hypothetical protein